MSNNEIKKKNVKEGFDPLSIATTKRKIQNRISNSESIKTEENREGKKDSSNNLNFNKDKDKEKEKDKEKDKQEEVSYIEQEYNESNYFHNSIVTHEKAYVQKETIENYGTLYLTENEIYFTFDNIKTNNKEIINKINNSLKYYLFYITKVEKEKVNEKYVDKYILEITLLNSKKIKYFICSSNQNYKMYTNLINFVYPKQTNFYYLQAKKYKVNTINNKLSDVFNGWNLYDPINEFTRQGAFNCDKIKICKVNTGFRLVKTYPEFLIVPYNISDNDIINSSAFRTKSRFPTLSYYSIRFKGSLWRSSQPKSGLTNNRNFHDEALIKAIKDVTGKLFIYDARPYVSTMANRIIGGGSEITENYGNVKLIFCDIDNIHAVSKAYQGMFSIERLNNKSYYKDINDCKWFEFIHNLLKFSSDIAINISNGYSVLVHCSDGWDRSTQLICLASLILDSFYRTAKGFSILIEKEFLSFGHQFGIRSGIIPKKEEADQRSPIFIQFLDCIFHLITQFPTAFEFNEEFLLYLANRFYSLQYGTFLFNNELERKDHAAKVFTISIWTEMFYIEDNQEENNQFEYVTLYSKFKNKNYNPLKYNDLLIIPNPSLNCLNIWENYFYFYGNILDKLQNINQKPHIYSFQDEFYNKNELFNNYKMLISGEDIKEEKRFHISSNNNNNNINNNINTDNNFSSLILNDDKNENYKNENEETEENDFIRGEINLTDQLNGITDEKIQLERQIQNKDNEINELKVYLNMIIKEYEKKGIDNEDVILLSEIKNKFSIKECDIV